MKFKWVQAYIRFVQKILLTIFLTLTYVVGFGLTAVVMVLVNRKMLGRKDLRRESFWDQAAGCEQDEAMASRQS